MQPLVHRAKWVRKAFRERGRHLRRLDRGKLPIRGERGLLLTANGG